MGALLMFQKVEREHGIKSLLTPKLRQLLKRLVTSAFNNTKPQGELDLVLDAEHEEKHDPFPDFPAPSAPPAPQMGQHMGREGLSDVFTGTPGETGGGEGNQLRRLMGSTTECLPIFSLLMLCFILFYGIKRCLKRSPKPLLPRWEPSDHD